MLDLTIPEKEGSVAITDVGIVAATQPLVVGVAKADLGRRGTPVSRRSCVTWVNGVRWLV